MPPCAECHGPSDQPKHRAYPRLDGQFADYLVLQLELFKAQSRGDSGFAPIMVRVAAELDREQMRDAAQYFASRRQTR